MRKNILLISISLFGALILPTESYAAVNLKKVNIVDGNQIELLFDGKVEPAQVKTEFVRDNIQLSLTNTSVYPAKVSMVSGSDLTKVFAYQYAPQLVRARFTVKGDAATYANRLQVKIVGKTVTVKIAAAKGDQLSTAAASALRTVSAPAEKAAEPEKEKEKTSNTAEVTAASAATAESEKKGLFSRVVESEKSSEKNSEKPAERRSNASTAAKAKETLTSGKSLTSPFRSIGVMLFVLGIFGIFVMFLKRLKTNGGKRSAKGLGGFLSKLSGQGAAKDMIEVVATHHLAPKRSIVVVRVQDRMLVLGMTNDSVNLITEFKANENGDAEENIGLGDFAASLKQFENETPAPMKSMPKANLGDIAAAALGLGKPKPASVPRANAAASAYQTTQSGENAKAPTAGAGPAFSPALAAALAEPSVKPSIRAQIKDRVQGMKQL